MRGHCGHAYTEDCDFFTGAIWPKKYPGCTASVRVGARRFPGYHEVGVTEGGVVENRIVPGDLVFLGALMRGDAGSQVDLKGFNGKYTTSKSNAAPDGISCGKVNMGRACH